MKRVTLWSLTTKSCRDELVNQFRAKLVKQPAELSFSRLSLSGPHEIVVGSSTLKRYVFPFNVYRQFAP